jgi:hypothetical protein
LERERWGLTIPSFGRANQGAGLGDLSLLNINEWFAFGEASARDFVELFNPDFRPLDLTGCVLSDRPGLIPAGYRFPPMTFIAGHESVPWFGNGGAVLRADELPFKLAKESGLIRLFDPLGAELNAVAYGYQARGVSEGRSPSGGKDFGAFPTPSPGALNPGGRDVITSTTISNRQRPGRGLEGARVRRSGPNLEFGPRAVLPRIDQWAARRSGNSA